MTDKEKLDKLVAEIKRRITFFKEQSVRKTTTDDNSCALALQGVICFYDSMQKEPATSLWHDARKEEPKPLERYVFVSDMIAPTIQGTFTRPSQAIPWCEYVETYSIVKWAYLDDLLKL